MCNEVIFQQLMIRHVIFSLVFFFNINIISELNLAAKWHHLIKVTTNPFGVWDM